MAGLEVVTTRVLAALGPPPKHVSEAARGQSSPDHPAAELGNLLGTFLQAGGHAAAAHCAAYLQTLPRPASRRCCGGLGFPWSALTQPTAGQARFAERATCFYVLPGGLKWL